MEIKSIEILLGQVVKSIVKNGQETQLTFTLESGEVYIMSPEGDDYGSSAYIEDIIGDLNDLISYPITIAEEVASEKHPEGIIKEDEESFL